NGQAIPHSFCGKPVVDAATRDRIAYFDGKADALFSLSIYFVVLGPALAARGSLAGTLLELAGHPQQAWSQLRARFSANASGRLEGLAVGKAEAALLQKVESFRMQVGDFVSVRLLSKDEAFRVLKRTLNFDQLKLDSAKLKHDTFLDYYLPESHLECHRSHL